MDFFPRDMDVDSLNEWESQIEDSTLSEYMQIALYSSNRASVREIESAKSSFDKLDGLKDTILGNDELEWANIDQATKMLDENEGSLVDGLTEKQFDFVRSDERWERYIDFDEFDSFVNDLEEQLGE